MTREELTEKLAFVVNEDIQKTIAIYVTSPQAGLQLFNIKEDNLADLQKMFINTVSHEIFEDKDFTIEDYSTSLVRENVYYRFDMAENRKPQEMINMKSVLDLLTPDSFDTSKTAIETIDGIYVVIRGNDGQKIVLYKSVANVDKIYSNSSIFMVVTDHDQFKRMDKNMLRISPTIQMLWIEDEIVLLDLKRLERNLKLDDILIRETKHDIASVYGRGMLTNDSFLHTVCEKPSMCKKLRHAVLQSKVITKNISNKELIAFALKQTKLKFHFNEDASKFDLRSQAEAKRFIKLMDDDFLKSGLTQEDYDSKDKEVY